MSNDKHYMRVYMRERYHRIRVAIIQQLGGKCTSCGATDKLEVDHIDGTKKTMRVERITYVSEARRQEELKNCQLLCDPCHTRKTVKDRGFNYAKGTHGTLSSARYCRCDECRAAKNRYNKEWKARKRMGQKQK